MNEEKEVWICSTCGEAENTDAKCVLEVFAGEPENCPINGEEADWSLTKQPT